MWTDPDARGLDHIDPIGSGRVTAPPSGRLSRLVESDEATLHAAGRPKLAASRKSRHDRLDAQAHGHLRSHSRRQSAGATALVDAGVAAGRMRCRPTGVSCATDQVDAVLGPTGHAGDLAAFDLDSGRSPSSTEPCEDRPEVVAASSDASESARVPRSDADGASGGGAQTVRRRTLDAESHSWWQRLHAPEPVRGWAIADLYERLRREAAFHVRQRAAGLAAFPRSDIDDLATQAAGDALMVLLRKLEDYRGDSQFWTWARKFAALEAPVSIRRRLGRDRVGMSRDPEPTADIVDPGPSAQDRAEYHELLESVGHIMKHELTARQRIVLTEIAINGVSTAALAEQLDTTPGAIYKSLHDARVKVRRMTAQLELVC
jgi:RNA polymerase sigma-70 factor (ECF subfamily)